jgi:hypothetical protein
VIGVVTVIDIGDTKFHFEHCCRKSHVILSTQVVFPEQSGRFEGGIAGTLQVDAESS